MGRPTELYGYIIEYSVWERDENDIHQRVYEQNEKMIDSLPAMDAWPPLSREMFSICRNDKELPLYSPNLEYFGRMIHFGAYVKGIERYWGEWKVKFEDLLSKLYFCEARVHINSDYSGKWIAEWEVWLNKYEAPYDGTMPPIPGRELWEYKTGYQFIEYMDFPDFS